MPKIGKHSTILKYGAEWKADADPLGIEREMISRFGRFTFRGRTCGEGLAFHVKRFIQLGWPEMQWNRWCDLMADEFCRGGRLAVFGPSSSWKSYVLSRCAQAMFYAFPGEPDVEQSGCTCIISSTTLGGLHRRIWDYVVSGHKSIKKRHPWLPGSLIESKTMLLADEKDEEGRSYKNGIIGVACKKGGEWQGLEEYVGIKNRVFILLADECFTGDTRVDTPRGTTPIRSIRVGDQVYNASGVGAVKAVSKRRAKQLFLITMRNGTTFKATPNHPFLTQKGWVKACDLNRAHYMLATHEAMRMVSEGIQAQEDSLSVLRKLLRSEMVAQSTRSEISREAQASEAASTMQALWTVRYGHMEHVLQPELQCQVDAHTDQLWAGSVAENSSRAKSSACAETRVERGDSSAHARHESNGQRAKLGQDARHPESHGPQAQGAGRKWNGADQGRSHAAEALSRGSEQLRGAHLPAAGKWIPNSLQGRCGISRIETGCGMRWNDARSDRAESSGQEEGCFPEGSWVDSVKVLQPGCSGTHSGRGRDYVYNLQVEGHPSYSVNGFLVHNCHFMPMGFLDALANLESNGRVFTAMMGNLPNVHNPLGRAAEPKLGWEALPDTEKSRVYETRWFNGRCVQLIGTDSPNLDFPEGEEPFNRMIGREYIRQCEYNYGAGSDKFLMFASGKVPKSSLDRSVFTKSQCLQFNAMEQVVWSHEPVTRGYCMDAAYSGVGGDRTVGAPFIFGKDNTGHMRFWLGPITVYRGSDDIKQRSHAEAIAMQCKQECEAHGIPPDKVFYDGTGRSELTSAFARLWSSSVVPLEFGGAATTRPTFTGETWRQDERKGKPAGELKQCCDVFDRFVSELWFAIRHAIMANQLRGLTPEFIDENSQRRWELVRGSRYSVEPKESGRTDDDGKVVGMKARGLRSPDTGDMLACGLEGARRLGFPLGKHTTPEKRRDNSGWFRMMKGLERERAREAVLSA